MKREERRVLFDQPIRSALIIIFLGVLSLGSFYYRFTLVVPRNDSDEDYRYFTIVMIVTYENPDRKGEVWYFTEQERELGLFMNNSWQTVYLLNNTFPIGRQEDNDDGNSVAFMIFPSSGIAPGENLTYEVSFRVVLKPRSLPKVWENISGVLQDIPYKLQDSYCKTEGPWEITNPEIRSLAKEIIGNETRILTIITEFISFIKQNIEYKTLDVPRYPKETLDGGVGDCDDQANLLITLCRAVGIPAYLQIGCIHIPSKNTLEVHWDGHQTTRLSKIGWHGWAMIYVPPWGWLPVDQTYTQGDPTDPLNSIKGAAIITCPTVLYANITQTDYITTSRHTRTFIIEKGYNILENYIMKEEDIKEDSIQKLSIANVYSHLSSRLAQILHYRI